MSLQPNLVSCLLFWKISSFLSFQRNHQTSQVRIDQKVLDLRSKDSINPVKTSLHDRLGLTFHTMGDPKKIAYTSQRKGQ